MRIRFDNILLCVLWLLAMTLGASFWFNTAYGFDIFSASHWQYLSYMQASRTPVRPGFYISMVIVAFLTVFGLYLIARPRLRKIRLPIIKMRATNPPTATPSANTNAARDASTLDMPPAGNINATTQSDTTPAVSAPDVSARPPRLVIPTTTKRPQQMPPQSHEAAPAPRGTNDWPELRQIFESAGYVTKPVQKINGIPIALLAIGTNETLWIGGVDVRTTDLRQAINRLQQVFNDTLDETYITVNGFVINAPDADTSEFQDILMFNSISDVQQYMQQMPNPPIPDDDDTFDAYSQYIDAVINHIGKI